MDKNLETYLKQHKIQYEIYNHEAAHKVSDSKKIKSDIPGQHTKSLFLKDNQDRFYLICLPADKRLNTSLLKKQLKIKDFRFASEEELKQQINSSPGNVSIFCSIYSKSIFLILDRALWNSDLVGFHPNINTATIVLNHDNLEKFWNSLSIRKEVLEL